MEFILRILLKIPNLGTFNAHCSSNVKGGQTITIAQQNCNQKFKTRNLRQNRKDNAELKKDTHRH